VKLLHVRNVFKKNCLGRVLVFEEHVQVRLQEVGVQVLNASIEFRNRSTVTKAMLL
jgi:hypothetical protein